MPRGAGGEAQRGCGAPAGAVRTASVMGRPGVAVPTHGAAVRSRSTVSRIMPKRRYSSRVRDPPPVGVPASHWPECSMTSGPPFAFATSPRAGSACAHRPDDVGSARWRPSRRTRRTGLPHRDRAGGPFGAPPGHRGTFHAHAGRRVDRRGPRIATALAADGAKRLDAPGRLPASVGVSRRAMLARGDDREGDCRDAPARPASAHVAALGPDGGSCRLPCARRRGARGGVRRIVRRACGSM